MNDNDRPAKHSFWRPWRAPRLSADGKTILATGRRATLAPISPSAATRTRYDLALSAEIDQMDREIRRAIALAYPDRRELIALDASAAAELRAAMRKLSRRWIKRFDELGPELAKYFTLSVAERVESSLAAMLRAHQFTVRFKMTAAMTDIVQATVAENVALIKSIASEHLTAVEGAVMRSVSVGRDLGTLTSDLVKQHGVTRRRAARIALDQNNKATAVFTRVRQLESGIVKAKWLHSAGGKTPRPEHVAFSGKTYDVARGAYLEGVWTWPGVEINCRCVSMPVIPGYDD